MELEKTLALTSSYGVATVMLFIMASFLAWLIYYVLKQNEKREARLIGLSEVHVNALQMELRKQSETTSLFRQSMLDAQKYQRDEHERIIEMLDKIINSDRRNA